MTSTLADAYVRLRPLIRDFVNDANTALNGPAEQAGTDAGKSFGNGFGTAVKAAVAGAAILAGVAAKGLVEAVGKASDLAETQSKVNVVFGKGAPAIQAWAATAATALGQSNQTALDGAATFALYGKAAGKTGADLVKFSTSMAQLASDVGSFNNADPAQVIADFGSAMRGEFDPIEKYGVLLNETVVKNEALALGLIKTTKAALTPQQRVLAVQAAILKQTGDAQGDFARTSTGLANQQRILSANFDNLTASVGQSFLPVAVKLVTIANTKIIPALQELWRVHGPKVTAWLTQSADKFGALIDRVSGSGFDGIKDKVSGLGDSLSKVDWKTLWAAITDAMKTLKENGAGVNETISVASVVIGFLADHVDTLAEYLPLLVAGWVAYKVAQAAANVVALAQVPIQAAQAASMFGMRGAMAANTAALNANTLALGGNVPPQNAGILARIRAAGSWIALQARTAWSTITTHANTAATWISTQAQAAWATAMGWSAVASLRASAASVWARVVTIAGTAATWLATAATWALGAAMTFVAGPIGIIILVVAALVAGIIYAYKHNETFRNIVQAVWTFIKDFIKGAWENVIKPVWEGIVWFVMNAIVPAFKWLWSVIKDTWNGISGFISGAWNNVIKPTFNFLSKFITETIPNAFRSGVDTISNVWSRIKDVAKVPIRFVIETVINNGIIGVFNSVADFLHLPSSLRIPKVPMPPGFAGGGLLPGAPSDVDNMFGRGPGGQLIALASGEFVVNARSTRKALPLLEWINRGAPGFAGGGLLDFLSGPIDWVKGKLSSPISQISERFGSNAFAQLGLGVANRAKDGVISRVKELLSTSDVASGGGGTGGMQPAILAVLAALRAIFGNVGVISGLRPGSRTLTGNVSYHASGRAFDISPVLSWARFLNAAFGTKLRELITPWNDLNIHNGRPHRYSGAVWNQHNFAGGNAHIHAAMAQGGRIFDNGGAWPSGTVGYNMSGRTEQVLNGDATDRIVSLLSAILSALRGLGAEISEGVEPSASLRRASRSGALPWPS